MEKTMRDYTTQTRIGATIGKAMARDVLAEDMPREWTGLDPQDADELTAAGGHVERNHRHSGLDDGLASATSCSARRRLMMCR